MATSNYNTRFISTKDLDRLQSIKEHRPGSVYHATKEKVVRLKAEYDRIQAQIKCIVRTKASFFLTIKNKFKIRQLEQQLDQIKTTIANWLTSVHDYFVSGYDIFFA